MATEGMAEQTNWHWKLRLCGCLIAAFVTAPLPTIQSAEPGGSLTVAPLGVSSQEASAQTLPAPAQHATTPVNPNATHSFSLNASGSTDASHVHAANVANDNAAASSSSSSYQTPAQATIEEALNRRGSITFRKMPLQEVVFSLSELWQINIVAGEKVTGEVSGVFNDAPLRDVLAAVLTSSGYGYTSAGSSLVVLPIDEVGTSSPEFRSRTIALPVANSQQQSSMIEAAKMLLSDRGKIQAFGNGRVLVIDSPERIAGVERMFNELSAGTGSSAGQSGTATSSIGGNVPGNVGWARTRIAYFTPQYTEAAEMGVSLSEALGSGVVASTPDASSPAAAANSDAPIVAVYEEENRIMVRGTPEQLTLAAEAFQQLDVPRAQVRISALIYDVNLEELESLGIQWGRGTLGGQATAKTLEFASLVPTGAIAEAGASTLTMGSIAKDFNASLIVEALDSTAEAKLLANPSITVGDRRDATIKIVTQIPYRTAETPEQSTSDEGTSVITQQIPTVEFKEAGITLVVRPRISNDGIIEMVVKPKHSTQTGTVNFLPIIDEREAETTVRVANGQTFVMGGLRQKKIVENVYGIPYLQEMKYVGKLFQSHKTSIVESELIVFLKPEIVSPCHPGLARERQAARISMCQLDQIPYASLCPQTPYCNDLNCPNHHPRARINGGSSELQMLGGVGMTPFSYSIDENQPYYPAAKNEASYDGGTSIGDGYSDSSGTRNHPSVLSGHPPVNVAPYESIPAPIPMNQ
ncbi:MAG: secretin N-terminal domain-containing protein [Rhodopirellula sp. JB044]|uniref:secretin N-terminal domain-containing protein n=1 Tax=Rhodopirellula sp. JB044 TaxID=3342844 RepID=UPI00370B62AF